MENKKNINEIVIQRETSFCGKRCVGLDSGFIVSLICYEYEFQEYHEKMKDSLFNLTHEECVGGATIKIEDSEVFRILTTRKSMPAQIAKDKIRNFLSKYKIKVIAKT